jgi:hypothetical protein
MSSDDLYHWETFQLLIEPQFDWEFVQIGNCGSPDKTEKGWLLLTHGVGAMRKYVISAIFLDLQDPSKIIGRFEKTMITAEGGEREVSAQCSLYLWFTGTWKIPSYSVCSVGYFDCVCVC